MPRFALRQIYVSVLMIMIVITVACKGENMTQQHDSFQVNNRQADVDFVALEKLKVYFGHRSVGYNIIDGVKDIMNGEKSTFKMTITEYDGSADFVHTDNKFNAGVFIHSKIGENHRPYSKIDDFEDKIKKIYGNEVDVAFFKFCFVDINPKTDVKKVFEYYQSVMNRLKTNYPKTMFVHCTVPLTVLKKTFKTYIKKIIGRANIWEYENLIAINRYNQLLLEHYNGKEPVFDLAQIESTYTDGKRCLFKRHGDTYFSLLPEYTKDGGHLNELGRRIVAEQLILFLVKLKY